MKKIAIIGSEGGMSSAYFAGAILALVEKFNLTDPYIVIGSSGSTGTLAYYVSKQYKSIENIWQNLLPQKEFISPWRLKEIMDIDYLIDVIFKKQDVLNIKTVKESNIKFFISITNINNGKLEYVTNKDDTDIFEALRASSAAPIVYNKIVKIKNNEYVDGCIEAPLSTNITKAKQEGAEVIIAINDSNPSFIEDTFLKIYSLFRNKSFRKRLKHYLNEKNYHNNDKNVLIIKPSTRLPISAFDNNQKHIIETMQIGYNDIISKSSLIQELILIT